MSMRDYAVNDYGLLMTREMMKMVASKVCANYTDKDYAEDEWSFNEELYDKGIVEYIGSFTGESVAIDDNGVQVWSYSEHYNNDVIYYCPMQRISTLFKAAYEDIDEMIAEFQQRIGQYLPDDFDYREYIRNILGTYYG